MSVKNPVKLYLAGALVSVVAAFGLVNQASAAIVGRGFFSGISTSGNTVRFTECGRHQSWHLVICGGIPERDYRHKAGIISFIKNKLNSGNSHDRLGAAFVIFTMLGMESSSSRTPTQEQVADWEARINNPAVTISSSYRGGIWPNSAYIQLRGGIYDMAYINTTSSPSTVVSFWYNGREVYMLKTDCVNPVGNMPGLPPSSVWDANGRSSVDRATATVGDTVNFSHHLRNDGSASTGNLNWTTNGTQNSSGTVALNPGEERQVSTETFTVPATATPGQRICRWIEYPDSQANPNNVRSAEACVTIISNYDLFPYAETSSRVVFPGGTVDVGEYIVNDRLDSDRESPYAVYEYVIRAGRQKPTDAETNAVFNRSGATGAWAFNYTEFSLSGYRTACEWLMRQEGFRNINCPSSPLANGQMRFPQGNNPFGNPPINANTYNPGDTVCRLISVGWYRYDLTDPNMRRASRPVCVVVAKQPNLQVWGGDIRVGDSIYSTGENGVNNEASVYTKTMFSDSNTYGSWVEYSIFAPARGVISSVSGGAISGNTGFSGVPSFKDVTPLSFANIRTGYTDRAGYWTAARVIASSTEQLQGVPLASTSDRSSVSLTNDGDMQVSDNSLRRVYLTNNNVTINQGSYGKTGLNGSLIIEAAGTVVIKSNIIVNRDRYDYLGNATQVVIIARNIIVDNSVDRIDAWLVATPSNDSSNDGVISTCDRIASPYYAGLTIADACNGKPLQINGVVMAKEVQFRRTFGATKDNYAAAAEVINMRPDVYIWGNSGQGSSAGTGISIETMFTKELPPRF